MELIALFVGAVTAFVILYFLCYLCFLDTDIVLALAEMIGRPVSVYRGKVIWITGASSGLGEAMAYELASVGAKLILTARNKTRLEQVRDECLEMSHGRLDKRDILVLPFDITNYGVHKTNVHDALNHFGQIDVLVNNAARLQIGMTENTDTEVDKDMFDVNFFGPISLTKLVMKHFLDRRTGHIVVISSLCGKFGGSRKASYSATKHALHGYFDSLRAEHNQDGIHVTTVCPGFFESEILFNVMGTKKGETKNRVSRCTAEMSTSRCAHLTLVAAANHLYEAWIAYPPLILITWVSQYIPDIFKYFNKFDVTSKR